MTPAKEESTEETPIRLAAIDIGTNSMRLVVVEIDPQGAFRVLDEEREQTRLGHGLYETGRLGDAEMERSLETLGRMKAIAEGRGVSELRAIATSAVREARNGRTFRRQAERRHSLKIEPISGREEARLAFLSLSRQFKFGNRPIALVDIGGGSVELVLAAGSVIDRVYSLPLGAVRLTETFVRSDPLKKKEWKKLRKAIDREIDRRVGKPPLRPEIMVGSGGTFSTLGAMVKSQREGRAGSVQGYAMARAEVMHLLGRLREAPLDARKAIPGLNPERADIITTGIAAIARLAKRLGTREIVVNEGGVREGLLLSMAAERTGRRPAAAQGMEDRMEWIRQFARKCQSNEAHNEHVADLALQIFDDLRDHYDMPIEARQMLQAGALLHDIGYLISHSQHHKHAYHLIMHGDLPRFSAREVELIANVARYHRRAYPKKKHENYSRLDKEDRKLVRRLAGILRVAAHSQAVTGVRAVAERDRVNLLVGAAAAPQVELWDANRKAGLFQKAFKTSLHLEWSTFEPRLETDGGSPRDDKPEESVATGADRAANA
jgi:exopolyphosphatase/guanosine-5'-triphosphate,3'-diphosphate pyrophosphatase